MAMRTAPLLLKAATNVDFEWNVVVELPGATFPVDDSTFDLEIISEVDGSMVLHLGTGLGDGSLSVVEQQAGAETVTLAHYAPQSAIADLSGAYRAALVMTRGSGVSGNLAVGTIDFEPIPAV